LSYHPHPITLPPGTSAPTGTPDRFEAFDLISDEMVVTHDGARLATDVYLPRGAKGPVPAILTRLPYGKTVDFMGMAGHGAYWARKGYAFVCQDVRGRFGSDGVFDAPLGSHEIADSHDTIDWVARQPWSNGRVGMWGESYYGFTAWCGAMSGHPALAAICPADPAGFDLYDLFWRQGCFPLNVMGAWGLAMEAKDFLPFDGYDPWILPLADTPEAMAAPGRLYRDWLGHETRGDFWADGDLRAYHDKIAVPVLLWGGWYDNIMGPWMADILEVRAKSPNPENKHLLVGPWDHESAPNYTGKVGAMEVGFHGVHRADTVQAFFDHYLAGIDNGFDARPKTEIFVMGENTWRFEESWPPAAMVPTPYYLHGNGAANTRDGDGRLDTTAPGDEPADNYVYDPLDPVADTVGTEPWAAAAEMKDRGPIEDRPDVLCYSSAALETALEITGPIAMHLHAASSAVDTDFAVCLVDVFPDGHAHEIQHGIVRASHRDPDAAPGPIEPGRVYAYEIDLWWTSHVVLPGHRLRLEITSSRFNAYARNLNSGEAVLTGCHPVMATQTIHHDRAFPSAIVLPVIPR